MQAILGNPLAKHIMIARTLIVKSIFFHFNTDTSLSAQERYIVTTLPNELLCRIIDLCRPEDFEASVLACKRFYQVAHHLVVEQNHCKKCATRSYLERAASAHIVVRTPFDFLEHLKTRPKTSCLTSFVTSKGYFCSKIRINFYYYLQKHSLKE